MNTDSTPAATEAKRERGSIVIEYRDGKKVHIARIRLADGSRPRIELDPGMSDAKAKEFAASLQEQEDEHGALLKRKIGEERAKRIREALERGESFETCDEWHKRFSTYREGRVGSAAHDEPRWLKWVSPVLGHIPVVKVEPKDIRAVVRKLDEAVEAELIAPKTAMNIWSMVTTAFKEAATSKHDGLRVLEGRNPCRDVQPPEKGTHRKQKSFLYPIEITRLLACEDVPLEDRELYALACYLYVRPGELRELVCSDVDFVAGIVNVSKAWDWGAEKPKSPKTSMGTRHVPIHPSLVPLLRRLCDGKESADRVVPLLSTLSDNKMAERFRAHLVKAKIDRSILFERSDTRLQVNFRSLRDTGITWLALAKVDVISIQRRAGHESAQTTLGYIKAAEVFGADIGQPFPPLPESLGAGPAAGPEKPAPPEINNLGDSTTVNQAPEMPCFPVYSESGGSSNPFPGTE